MMENFSLKLHINSLNGKRKCDFTREYDLSSSLLDKWIKQSTSTGSFKENDNGTEFV